MRGPRLSVRARLALWHAGVLTFIVCLFSAGTFVFVRESLFAGVDRQLTRALETVDWVYHHEPEDIQNLPTESGIRLFRVVAGGDLYYQTESWERAELAQGLPGSAAPESWKSPDGRWYRVQVVTAPGYTIAAAVVEGARRDAIWTLVLILAAGIPLAAALAVAGGYFLAGRALAPVGAMADKARQITADCLGERLPVANPLDEFGRLATVFNDTLSRLCDSFERLRRFTADASHELRTPLTAMRSVGEVALQRELDAVGYREVIGSMLEEVQRLARLVDSLLVLTRADSSAARAEPEVVELAALAGSVADNLRVLADEKRQRLEVDAGARVEAVCDPSMLRLGLMNLLHNAIKYTPDGGAIQVRARANGSGESHIEVQDTGPGIAPAYRERIFERFYRGEAGGNGISPGAGLGLAIARWAVAANGGRIELESEESKGSLFRIVLPTASSGGTTGRAPRAATARPG